MSGRKIFYLQWLDEPRGAKLVVGYKFWGCTHPGISKRQSIFHRSERWRKSLSVQFCYLCWGKWWQHLHQPNTHLDDKVSWSSVIRVQSGWNISILHRFLRGGLYRRWWVRFSLHFSPMGSIAAKVRLSSFLLSNWCFSISELSFLSFWEVLLDWPLRSPWFWFFYWIDHYLQARGDA